MEFVYPIVIIWMLSADALGVGASTLAVASFLTALHDGKIDSSERRMLGVVYWSLRSAMLMILITLGIVSYFYPESLSGKPYLWGMLFILYANAIGMTYKLIPSSIGPALQAATWYTYGFVMAIMLFDLYPLTPVAFAVLYFIDYLIAFSIINGLVWWFTRKNQHQ